MLTEFRNEPLTDFTVEENRKKMEEALSKIEGELGRTYKLFIDGKWVEANETFNSINPSNKDEIVGIHQKGSQEHAERALEAATKAFETWRFVPPEERALVLLRAASILRERKFEFAAWQVFEVGKNWVEADADVAEAIDYLEFYAREILRYSSPQPLTPIPTEMNELVYIPLGPVVVIPPWNFPLAIMLGMTTAALVTGNTVVLKPSSDSPTIATKFVELMNEAGIPEGVLNLVSGPGSTVGDYLVGHPKTRMIAFTGSKEVGIRIYELASRVQPGQIWLKRVIAEMGGKDAIIVDSEADLEDAANGVVASAFGYQGQKCSAASRLILLSDIYDEFIEMIVEKTRKLSIGPAKENHPVGPVINASSEAKILSYIEKGKGEGELMIGGEKAPGNGFFIKPTIFKDVSPDATIAQEEIFGPVLAVIKAGDFDEAIEIANNTEYGLTGSLYSLNRLKIEKVKKLFHVGNLYINRKCTGALVGVHPFGGFNMSGTDSKAGGRDYLLLFLQAKSISEKYR
jgi:1-pyrroline-5-carboxylate dehydrogenase